jgi:hypothetical protein
MKIERIRGGSSICAADIEMRASQRNLCWSSADGVEQIFDPKALLDR